MNYNLLVSPEDRAVLSVMRLPGRNAIYVETQSNEIDSDGKSVIRFSTDSQELFDAWRKTLVTENRWFRIA
jgi:hypothetical protein